MNNSATEVATFAGGCFWCLEAVYSDLRGVSGVKSGYTGGHRADPTYEQVCTGTTGHAEAVQVAFDPAAVSYRSLLDVFFTIHDPTTLDRQGADLGTQYRSAVFFHSAEQERAAREAIGDFAARGIWGAPIVTELTPLSRFWPAESNHDDYFARNPMNPYCEAVIAPKVAKARKAFLEMLRAR